MSGITDSKTSIKKVLMINEDVKTINSDNLPKFIDHLNKLLKSVESFENEKNTNIKTIDTNTDTINNLKNRISQNEREIIKLDEDNKDLTTKKQELLDKNQEVQHKTIEIQENIKNKKEEFESRNHRLKELEKIISDLSVEQHQFDEKIATLQKKLEGTYQKRKMFVEGYMNRVAAMNLLISKQYIHSDQIKLIKSLQKNVTLDLKSVLLGIDIKEDKAKQILKAIVAANGPIKYDEAAGKVTLLEEVRFT